MNLMLHAVKWEPSFKNKENENKTLIKNARSILNKLTENNLSKLVAKFIELLLLLQEKDDYEQQLNSVFSLIYEKINNDSIFYRVYTTFVCEVLKQSVSKSENVIKSFRMKNINHCLKEFEHNLKKVEENLKTLESKLKDVAKPEDIELIKLEIKKETLIVRSRRLRNINFIGKLFKSALLTPKVINKCIDELILQKDDGSFESLCSLLTTVGQKLENQLKDIEEQAQILKNEGKPIQKWIPEPKFMDQTFKKLRNFAMSNDESLSFRIRFALLDVYELRRKSWVSESDENVEINGSLLQTLTEIDPSPAQIIITEPNSETEDDFDRGEIVKNIFKEFESVQDLDYEWIREGFPDDDVIDFVYELFRQACSFSKDAEQKAAGAIIRLIIENNLITKDQVIICFCCGVLAKMANIIIDIPKALTYLREILIEALPVKEDLSWFSSLVEGFGSLYIELSKSTSLPE